MSDHYEELGVEPTATKDEIREAHRTRLAELESQRDRKGVTEAQLQANREEAARVRSAWSVLSDPLQRQRYDQQLMDERASGGAAAEEGSDVELVDDDTPAAPAPTGWRKLLAPPPKGAAGASGAAAREPKPPATSNRPAPTVVLPPGMRLAEPKSRGMALAFDLAICVVIYTAVMFVVPGLVNSDYATIVKQIDKVQAVSDAQQSVNDAQESLDDAKSASDEKSAQKDLNKAEKDLQKAEKEAKDEGVTPASASSGEKRVDALDDQVAKLNDEIRSALFVAMGVVVVLVLAYLAPITAIKGYTMGMRNRRIKVVRVDGSPCGWYAAITRFAVPVLITIALMNTLGFLGPLLGLGMVLWGFRDRNGQGVHDKLARTLVVDA